MKLKVASAIPQIAETGINSNLNLNLRFSINLPESLFFSGINPSLTNQYEDFKLPNFHKSFSVYVVEYCFAD